MLKSSIPESVVQEQWIKDSRVVAVIEKLPFEKLYYIGSSEEQHRAMS